MAASNASRTRDGYTWTREGSSTGLVTEAVVPSKITRKSYDVIVIGAGFAGLAAARDISERSGLNVLVLEARDRIGGRTFTAKAFDMDVEMGGTWVHWQQPHVWTEMYRYDLARRIKPSAAATDMVYRSADGSTERGPVAEYFARIVSVVDEFCNIDGHTARTLIPYPYDQFREPALWRPYAELSVQDRLDQMAQSGSISERDVDFIKNIASGVSLAPADRTRFVDFLKWIALGGYTLQGMVEAGGVYKIGDGGMTTLARKILDDYRGDILFDAVVMDIVQESEGVKVVLKDDQSFQAGQVISTIPLNVLKSINFVPELPPLHREAVEIGHVGRGSKIHFKVSPSSTPWVAFASQGGKNPFNSGTSDNLEKDSTNSSHFVGFGITDIRDHESLLADFDTYLNDVPKREVVGYVCHDWTGDPFSQGTWAPGASVKHGQELQKPHGKVLFASSDWADGWLGFIDGAIEQGKKAAIEVLASVKK